MNGSRYFIIVYHEFRKQRIIASKLELFDDGDKNRQ